MYTVRRGNANDFVWGFVLGTFVVIERQLPGYSPLCVCLLCGSRLFLWIFHAVLRTSLVEGWLHGGRCITVSCFMFAQAAQRFVPRMQKLGIVAGVLCNVAFTIMRQQQAQSA